MIPDYTVVVGVDANRIGQLSVTLPTWKRYKPSLFKHPWVVFCEGVTERVIRNLVNAEDMVVVGWPPEGVTYAGENTEKWNNPQRHKMLAGFVHVPASLVNTPYWLKLDSDAVASGYDDWIDPEWFEDSPSFIGPKWPFTKPGQQMLELDRWVANNPTVLKEWADKPPLNLAPPFGSERLGHKRAVSWCAFFRTDFTVKCSAMANKTCGFCQIPVASHDGYFWYMATRGGYGVNRINVKRCGWTVRNTMKGIMDQIAKVERGEANEG